MHYWPLDFYRFFAAFTVTSSHFFLTLNSSPTAEFISILGVELFFVLSGFVLTPHLLKVQDSPSQNIKIFLIRRWLRTIPPYIIALTCAAILFGYGDLFNFVKFLSYTQNLVSDSPKVNFFPVAWSLSVEEWFYILTPLLILCLSRIYKNKNNLLVIGLSIIVIINLARLGMNDGLNWGEDVRRSVLLRGDAIFFGVIAYLLLHQIKTWLLIYLSLFSLIFLFIIGINPNLLSTSVAIQNLFLPIASLFFSSIILLITFINLESKLIKKIAKFSADISYSMYLFHLFFIYFFINFSNKIFVSFLVYNSALIFFCYLFFIFFEKPILEKRRNFKYILKE